MISVSEYKMKKCCWHRCMLMLCRASDTVIYCCLADDSVWQLMKANILARQVSIFYANVARVMSDVV